jgi:putative sugar O-methyltransferase
MLMTTRIVGKNTINRVLEPFGAQVISQFELKSLKRRLEKFLPAQAPVAPSIRLPQRAAEYLSADNPRLTNLRSRYKSFNSPAVNHSLWTDSHASLIDLKRFRGDNPYVWQYQDQNAEINYLLTAYYLRSIDKLGLLDCLAEDGLFGVSTVQFDDQTVLSRDLLDSVSEVSFLEEQIELSKQDKFKVLDIGAGYGRFANRLCESLPVVDKVICVDAVAESTFLSEFYLRFRGVDDRTEVAALDEIEQVLDQNEIHLAVNIHSFSECSMSATMWWLDLLRKHRVRYLFIVPNAGYDGGATLAIREPGFTESHDFMPEILSRGYILKTKRPKYASPAIQKYGVSPTHYYLFEFQS